MPRFVRLDKDTVVNVDEVAATQWDHARYSGPSRFTVLLKNGTTFTVEHQPNCLGGTDCYAVEAAILSEDDSNEK